MSGGEDRSIEGIVDGDSRQFIARMDARPAHANEKSRTQKASRND